ncbi:MAG: helix-turn-helix domain-containing protein, partial [Vicinamibacterales bacterium]
MRDEPGRRRRGRPPHPDILTPREWEVLSLIRAGLTNEQIALRLDVSVATAKYHVSEIISKLNVTTREEAAAWVPVDERPWWQRALSPPVVAVRRLWPVTVAKAAGIALALAALAGLAALVWSMQDGEETSVVAQPVPSREAIITPTLEPPSVTPSTAPTARPSLELGVYS